MAETVLELQRRYHEERERLSDAVVKEILHKKSTHKENINSEHRTKLLLDRHMEVSSHLLELYQDKDNTREEEIKAISTPNEFTEFYARLKSVKEFHRKHPNEISVPMSIEFQEWDRMRENPSEEANLVDFSGEEGYGRYLDLHESYLKYINLKGVEKVDYLTFLETFDQLFEIPKERKNSDYKAYLDGLIDYLFNYLSKIHPLMDLNQELDEVTKQFEQMWADGSFPGWPKDNHDSSANNTDGEHLDLSPFNSWEELASLGLDRLKSALMAIGLKCGGTLEERAQRLFSTKGKNIIDIDPALFAKGKQRNKGREDLKLKDVAFAESKVYRLTELVSEQRQATKENVQRKQARAQGEEDDEEDDEDGLGEVDDKDDDDDDVPYNPKNLPLGWDGKPIPYWLYKLHGLNISYVCEICGNFTYKGPKAFQRHFAEWRHAHGMRCLGIPNTAHFANVTGIEDAMKLWDKLKNEKNDERWKPDQEEEYEDSQGNVVNKKTYDDLKRQGLL